jgi:NAD(P)H-quinone oxidoreductase subunit 5
LELLFAIAVALPGAAFAVLSLAWLLGARFRERVIVWITGSSFLLAMLALVGLGIGMRQQGLDRLVVSLGEWFRVGEYHFPLVLLADAVSVPMLFVTVLLTGLVGSFSARYMHREEGFLYFFLLLLLFGFGSQLLFAAASFDLLVAGWECVGITSVLLIAYFHQRRDPVRNGLRVFAIYRLCDMGLLVGVVVLHHYAGSASVLQVAVVTGPAATLAGFLFLLAAAGKAAQFPFSSWLPRAMEGPTPSSAIFYGAISVHAGAYLLLRANPVLEHSALVQTATIAIGALSAVFGTLIGRASTDVKTALAWASVTQLGLIFVEIGLDLPTLALWHICGHAVVRTLQFLRAPSALHEFHQMHAASGGHLDRVGAHHEALLPLRVRLWLYRLALDRAHMDTILDRYLVEPALAVSRMLNRAEPAAPPRERRVSTGALAGESDV